MNKQILQPPLPWLETRKYLFLDILEILVIIWIKESRRTVVESEEYFIQELVDLEKDFEDEFFFECPEEDLEAFYEKRAEKVAKVKTVGKILDHMDEEQEMFPVSYYITSRGATWYTAWFAP